MQWKPFLAGVLSDCAIAILLNGNFSDIAVRLSLQKWSKIWQLFESWLKRQVFFGSVKGPQEHPILFQFRGESLIEGGVGRKAKHQPRMVRDWIYLESDGMNRPDVVSILWRYIRPFPLRFLDTAST